MAVTGFFCAVVVAVRPVISLSTSSHNVNPFNL